MGQDGTIDLAAMMRKALKDLLAGKPVDPGKLGLGADDAELLALMVEMVRFAQAIDAGVQFFLMELSVGVQMNTVQARGASASLANRLLALLDRRDGAMDALRDTLTRNRGFLIKLNEAYMAAIPQGSRELLRRVDPGEARARHRGPLGITFSGAALNDLAQVHGDLAQKPSADLFQEVFQQHFQRELARLIES